MGSRNGCRKINGQVRIQSGINIVRMDAVYHLLDADRPVIMDAGLFCTFQISIGAVLHPSQGRLVVIETDGADSACRVTLLAGLGAGSILTQQTTVGFFVNIHGLRVVVSVIVFV